MNFKEMMNAVLTALGLVDKARAETLTAEDWTCIESELKSKYNIDLSAAVQDAQKASQLEKERSEALSIINASTSTDSSKQEDPDAKKDPKPETSLVQEVKKMTDIIGSQTKTIAELQNQIAKMAAAAAPDQPKQTVSKPLSVNGPGTDEKYLYGIASPVFSLEKRWNRIAQNPGYAAISAVDEDRDGTEFRSSVSEYGKSIASRFAFLKANGMLNPQRLAAGNFSTNTSNLSNAGLGDQYVVIRQDALIAHVLQRFSVTNIFPVRSNVQDRELMTNAFFEQVSQAWQPGRVFKGGVKLQPEMGYVDDSMTKLYFPQMKEIERLYIGYLNTTGSDPIKWNMIEWMIVNIMLQMASEQNHRHIMGIYFKPNEGVAGHYLNAGTGIVYSLIRYLHENKLCPLEHPAYDSYTENTMLDAVIEFAKDVQSAIDVDQNIANYRLYLNERHKPWYAANIRQKYQLATDFSGVSSMMNTVPDTALSIEWVPNMENLTLMFVQEPGNLQLLENVPGEMFAIRMKDEMEAVLAWSVWKEGAAAAFVGFPFSNYAELKANNYAHQRVFMNLPCVKLDPDATIANASKGFIFLIGENSASTALTDISGAKQGTAYILRCGSHTSNATTIAKSGKFAGITAAFSPVKEGDYIMLVLNDEGNKFVELERCVDGKRTINVKLQPNVPGGR